MEIFFDYFTEKHGGKLLLTGNLNQADVAGLNIQDNFTKEVIEIWSNQNPTYIQHKFTDLVQFPYKDC